MGFTKQGIISNYSVGGDMAEEWAVNSAEYCLLCAGETEQGSSCSAQPLPLINPLPFPSHTLVNLGVT